MKGSLGLPEVLLELNLEHLPDSIVNHVATEVPSPLAPKWVLPDIGSNRIPAPIQQRTDA